MKCINEILDDKFCHKINLKMPNFNNIIFYLIMISYHYMKNRIRVEVQKYFAQKF